MRSRNALPARAASVSGRPSPWPSLILLVAAPAAVYSAGRAWPVLLPAWAPVATFLLLLPALFLPYRHHRSRSPDRVAFDDVAVTHTFPDGTSEAILWADLLEIEVLTASQGPGSDDFYWILRGASHGCAVPASADGNAELLARLQALPTFDDETLLKALGSTCVSRFTCWRRNPSSSPGARAGTSED